MGRTPPQKATVYGCSVLHGALPHPSFFGTGCAKSWPAEADEQGHAEGVEYQALLRTVQARERERVAVRIGLSTRRRKQQGRL